MNCKLLVGRLIGLSRVSPIKYQTPRFYSTTTKPEIQDKKGKENEEEEIPTNPLREIYSASLQKDNGVIYDKKPFRYLCEEGKVYNWCLCGQSKSQPFCDGTHNNIFLKIKLKPIKFTVTKTKEYWLCNCKQTRNRPFCDGTHKKPEIQEHRRY